MMVFDYNVITGQSYRWVDTPMEKEIKNYSEIQKKAEILTKTLALAKACIAYRH